MLFPNPITFAPPIPANLREDKVESHVNGLSQFRHSPWAKGAVHPECMLDRG
jgi:hypothetical protein